MRDAKRRGSGWSNFIGWNDGFHLLTLHLGREPLAFADLLAWYIRHLNSHQTFSIT
ncbi:MAG: hypothetical protein ACXWPS_01180 [Ktedonobacteraceae bacterium]